MKKIGFTLIELLVVMVILGILITLGSRTLRAARLSAKRAQALVEVKSIETAISAYHHKYGKLPVLDELQGREDLSTSDAESCATISILTAENALLNPAEMVFLETQGSAVNGIFVDPWGRQYQIVLDTDYDGYVETPLGRVRRRAAVLSVGCYEMNGSVETNDYVFSWQ